MHTDSGVGKLFTNPVLKGSSPNPGVNTTLYTVPGNPCDAQGNVRVCNTSASDQTFSVGWSTSTQTGVTYWEYQTTISPGCSLDVFSEDKWFPPTTAIIVWMSASATGVQFTYQGKELASETATPIFTGS